MNAWANWVGWLLVLHLIGMVLWIGGLFRALAVATGAGNEPAVRQQRAVLAQKALRAVAHPGAALMVITGALLFYLLPGVRMAPWLHVKLLLVVILIGCDLALTVKLRRMPDREPSPQQLGVFNGLIGLLFVLILVMVLVKPF
ncbi:MAG: CopD family protein [Terriglobales bacterium]